MEKCRTLPEQVVKNTQDIEDILNRPKANFDAYDLSLILKGTEDINIDFADGKDELVARLDSVYKNRVDNKLTSLQDQVNKIDVNIYKPVDLQEGTNLLTYNWDAYNNGTYFKGNNLTGVPSEVTGEVMIRLIKSRNTRYAIELYNTGLYEGNTGTYINYHYSDKFEGWEKIQTSLSNDFLSKVKAIYNRDIPSIAYGQEDGIQNGENIVSATLIENLLKYEFFEAYTSVGNGIGFLTPLGSGKYSINIACNVSSTINPKTQYHFLLIEGNKLTFKKRVTLDYTSGPTVTCESDSGGSIYKIYGGNL